MDRRTFMGATAAAAASSLLAGTARAQPAPKAKNVVLVHGLFADGSCWSEVIPRLQTAGLNVTAVQNPLTTLPEAVDSALRVLARQDGPTVLVGHSFSGMIVTDAGVYPNVSALVYVAARAPDAGEDYPALAKNFPTPPATAGIVFDGEEGRLGLEASYMISRVTCRRQRRRCCTRCNGRSTRPSSPARRPMQHGDRGRVGMRCPRKIGPSTPTLNASWPNAWAPKRSKSKRVTFR
jgi:pimeloyl-ACP methyl ester carboxylesterase